MFSLNSYSQQDTTKVILPTKTARLIYQDLLRYDGCKEELKLTQDKLFKVESREIKKDTVIYLLEKKDENNQFIISQKDLQITQYDLMTKDLQKELRGVKIKSFLYKVGTFLGVLTTSYLLIVK
jgi:hypothetical protein